MKSARPKVLHELCGRPMLWYVLRALREAGVSDVLVVASPDLEKNIAALGARSVVQREQLGTGHAVRIALDAMDAGNGPILIAYGDMPLVPPEIFRDVLGGLHDSAAPSLALVTVKMPLPSNFGRVIRNGTRVERIVEARDATPAELLVDEMNAGIYAFAEPELRHAVAQIDNKNAQGEYYLTDTISGLMRAGKSVVPVVAGDHLDVVGINDRAELALARREMNARLCERHMRDGVTIVDPATTYLEPELKIGADTVIYPNTTIGRLSEVGERCTLGPGTRLSAAIVGNGCVIRESVVADSELADDVHVGPFAHLREHARLEAGVRIGNFVEVKNSRLGPGVKANHLSYIGDADVGERSNIGAGTITCNFDGVRKNKTVIGRDVRIGSNTMLIAPVEIGDEALTGAGSVVTKDVGPKARVAGNPARPLPEKVPREPR
ncbi:MAG: bifunctional UDP-N-acetylglucosamine diphosphorylase/glucosamine-1-phosphate N-acetyltransferase GlmU [Candidatus Eremiobacteraeota bacterium]|nr:bifunctional UDP-N-acetylglucosamine diphosphorylase/glucosamine-1-phosphate N-acetyltransferase GlmU [Candidatus Eremiobacteraeota bacterium]